MPKITFCETGTVVEVSPDETLLHAAQKAGIPVDAPCGGHGKCGKCRVTLDDGTVVLACQTKADRDYRITSLTAQKEVQILTEGTKTGYAFDPVIRRIPLTVRPCPKGESIADWTRLVEALADAGYTVTEVNPYAASDLSRIFKETEGKVYAIVCEGAVLTVKAEEAPVYMAAFDIGTTTVAAYLLDAVTGRVASVASEMNPQRKYGGDVISRANYTLEEENGLHDMASCIRECVNRLLEKMTAEAGISMTDVYAVSVAGNTCMHHLFLGIDVRSLVMSPYNPCLEEPVYLRTADVDIHAARDARLFLLPNIAGFVGADTVACLVSTDLASCKEWTLLIDIGTNGEMVLGKNGEMVACSTAAGPAFEGAGITCGMRGGPGAISKVSLEDGEIVTSTIGGGAPVGICGSGLLDLAAALLEKGEMDESGELDDTVVLAEAQKSGNGEAVVFNQKDVRQLQLAKAAIASGIHLLMKKKGLTPDDIGQVWLAGAFGSFLSPKSACRIGMIPPDLLPKIDAVGNAAGEGAKLVLLDRELWKKSDALARKTDFLELATMPEFQDTFVDQLEFPV